MEEGQEKKYRISWKMIIFWVGIAIIIDLLTIIPIVGDIAGPAYWLIFGFYLYKTKHGLVNWKTLAPEIISVAGEMIPVAQALPSILAATIVIFVVSRSEDKTGISILAPLSKGQKVRLPNKIPPLNQGGVRSPR
jgi:hypothetical protein